MPRNAYRSAANYASVQRQTAGPGQRVVMMYDGIIRELNRALPVAGNPEPEAVASLNEHLQLAQRLILELKLALDHDQGGELADQLDGIYSFWRDHLSAANVESDPARIREVLDMARELRDAWADAAREARAGAGA